MKLLDEKGKLFGKINLIDLLVVLLLIALVAALGWKLLGGKVTEAIESSGPTYEYQVLCEKFPLQACESASEQVGGQLMASGQMIDGTITGCEIRPHTETMLDADGNAVEVEDPDTRDVLFTIRTKVEAVDNALSVGTQEVRIGKSHIVKTTMVEFTGTITSLERVDD